METIRFDEMDLYPQILRGIKEMGFEETTPIQARAIPVVMEGGDVIGQAQTGTGKTAAFGIPLLQKVDSQNKKTQALVLCPTRELAIQVAEEIRCLGKYMHGIKILPVYGGQDIGKQIRSLKGGAQIIIGTPGRVMDHLRRRTIRCEHVSTIVLDEADEMLNMGFREDIETVLEYIPEERQTVLFSATMPKPILEITNQFQNNARMIKVAAKELTIPLVSQRYYKIKSQDKDAACVRLLEYYQPKLCLIFCNTKRKVDELAEVLKKAGFQAEGLHGDMSQHQRDVAMNRFRNGSTNILIATDVAARGIDVDDVEAVINYDIPQDNEYYVHRIGRTGRAGRTGRSFTFVGGREQRRLHEIERVCHTVIEERKLPGASKVLKAKADKCLNRAWELHEHEDMELMKSFIRRKMEEEDCDALEIAAVMLKQQVGDKGPEIQVDEGGSRRGLRFGGRRDGKEGSDRKSGREESRRSGRRGGDRKGSWEESGRKEGKRGSDRKGGWEESGRKEGKRGSDRKGGWEEADRREGKKGSDRTKKSRREDDFGGGKGYKERDVRRDGSLRIWESDRKGQEVGSRLPKKKR